MCIQYRLGGSICLTVMAICKGIEIDTKQAYSPEGIIVACCCMYRKNDLRTYGTDLYIVG